MGMIKSLMWHELSALCRSEEEKMRKLAKDTIAPVEARCEAGVGSPVRKAPLTPAPM